MSCTLIVALQDKVINLPFQGASVSGEYTHKKQ